MQDRLEFVDGVVEFVVGRVEVGCDGNAGSGAEVDEDLADGPGANGRDTNLTDDLVAAARGVNCRTWAVPLR